MSLILLLVSLSFRAKRLCMSFCYGSDCNLVGCDTDIAKAKENFEKPK